MNQVLLTEQSDKTNDLLFCFSLFRCQFRPSLPVCALLVIALKMNCEKSCLGCYMGDKKHFSFYKQPLKEVSLSHGYIKIGV